MGCGSGNHDRTSGTCDNNPSTSYIGPKRGSSGRFAKCEDEGWALPVRACCAHDRAHVAARTGQRLAATCSRTARQKVYSYDGFRPSSGNSPQPTYTSLHNHVKQRGPTYAFSRLYAAACCGMLRHGAWTTATALMEGPCVQHGHAVTATICDEGTSFY
jgi:hypothetical protein